MSGLFLSHSDAVMHGEFMGFVLDEDSVGSLRGWAERQGYPAAVVQQGGIEMLERMMGSSPAPRMVMVDIDEQTDPAAAIARLTKICGGECRLVALGSKNDVGLYRSILNAGAVDYLVKPLSPEGLNQALVAAMRSSVVKREAREARVIVFVGARGGIGTSTIALNTAWLMAHELKQTVALLDLDLQFGTSSLALDLDPGHGLPDIVSSPNRVDALMIASSLVSESDRFSILCAEEPLDEPTHVESSAIAALLNEMKGNFDIIVIDLPRLLLAPQRRLLTLAQDVVIVSDLTLAGVRDTLRIKGCLNVLLCPARVTTVASRVNASGAGQITRATFEKGLKGTIDIIVPEDAASLTTAANSGKSLGALAPRAPITRILHELGQRLIDDDNATKKESVSFWSKIAGDGKVKIDKRGKS